jgi:uncharacterized protein
MKEVIEKINGLNWPSISGEINSKGFAALPKIIGNTQCRELIESYSNTTLFRKTVVMERYRFGLGEYKYFKYPLPGLIQTVRETVYPKLAPIANGWMNALNIDKKFPDQLNQLQALCAADGQIHPTALILKYGKGGFNTLHQDLYGTVFFPIQLVLFLNQPNDDYTGGSFVLTEQIPRAQSKAIVLQPGKGDMLLFTTNFRPVKGNKGYYRVNMKHGVSEITSGERHTCGIIFHDANT